MKKIILKKNQIQKEIVIEIFSLMNEKYNGLSPNLYSPLIFKTFKKRKKKY